MKRKKTIACLVAFLAFPLLSCSGQSDSTTSSSGDSSSTAGKVYLHDNYQRDGTLAIGLSGNFFGTEAGIGYESPISLAYQADEKKQYGDDASLSLYPYAGLSGTDQEKLDQAETNRQVLHGLMAFVYTFLSDQDSVDMGMLPVLIDSHADAFSSLADVPDEALCFDSVDSKAVVYDCLNETDIVYFHEDEGESEGLDSLDLSTLKINIPALLEFLSTSENFSEEELRPFLSNAGDVIAFLAKGLSVRVDSQDSDSCTLNFYINEDGKKIIEDGIQSRLGISLENVEIADLSFSIGLFNDDTLYNQIDSVEFHFKLSASLGESLPILPSTELSAEIYFEADLERTGNPLSESFFDDRLAFIDAGRSYYAEARPLFDRVKDYASYRVSLDGKEVVDTAKVDLSLAKESDLTQAAQDYFSLSDEAKRLLGLPFSSYTEEESLADALKVRYLEGVSLIEDMLSLYSQDPVVDETNYRRLFDTLVVYGNWEQGVIDRGGQDAITSLNTYLIGRFEEASSLVNAGNNAFSAFVEDPNKTTLASALALDEAVRERLSVDASYLTGERKTAYENAEKTIADYLPTLQKAFHSYLSVALSPISEYDDLSLLADEEAVLSADFFDRNLLTTSEKDKISGILSTESRTIRQELIAAATSASALRLSYLGMTARIEDLSKTEGTFLGSDGERENIVTLYQNLLAAFQG